jgi:hypothetical protein
MLQKTTYRTAVGLAAAAALLSTSPRVLQAEPHEAQQTTNGPHFAAPFSGAWFARLDAEPFGLPPGLSLAAFLTIHPDGTMLVYDAGDFGALPINQVQSPQFGSWVRTGLRSMRATTLFFVGDPITRDTTLVKRVRFQLRMEDIDHLVGVAVTVEQLDCPAGPFPGFLNCPNPIIAPDSAWIPEPGGAPNVPFEAWRLRTN